MYPILFRLPEWMPLLGGEPITSFGLFMLLAFVSAGYACRAELARMGHDSDIAWDLVFVAVIGGIVGAKLYFVLLNWNRLLVDPKGLIFAREGLVWYGGLIGAAALVILPVRRSHLPLAEMADAVAAPLAIGYAVGRIGCFMVGDDWGRPTGSWVGVRFPEGITPSSVEQLEHFGISVDSSLIEKYGQVVPVHPTQLYEVAMSGLIFLFLWKIRGRQYTPGWLFMVWLALAGSERFAVEFLRAKDDRLFGIFSLAQMISLVVVVAGVIGITRLKDPRVRKGTVEVSA